MVFDIDNLGPWIADLRNPGTQVRKNITNGEVVVKLFPEGFGKAKTWIWKIGNIHGKKRDREEARRMADEILGRLV
jgi:hypothetical protein